MDINVEESIEFIQDILADFVNSPKVTYSDAFIEYFEKESKMDISKYGIKEVYDVTDELKELKSDNKHINDLLNCALEGKEKLEIECEELKKQIVKIKCEEIGTSTFFENKIKRLEQALEKIEIACDVDSYEFCEGDNLIQTSKILQIIKECKE